MRTALLAGILVVVFGTAGFAVLYLTDEKPKRVVRFEDSDQPAKVQPKAEPAKEPEPKRVEPKAPEPEQKKVQPIPPEPNKVEPASKNAEWERKSRAKLKEGLALLSAGEMDDAVIALNYAFADQPAPANLTPAQHELMMEICERLTTIHIVKRDKTSAGRYATLAHYRRKDLGWDIDKYNEWAKPVFEDTAKRMGVPESKPKNKPPTFDEAVKVVKGRVTLTPAFVKLAEEVWDASPKSRAGKEAQWLTALWLRWDNLDAIQQRAMYDVYGRFKKNSANGVAPGELVLLKQFIGEEALTNIAP